MDPISLGFDPKLAAHAAASLPVYAAAFTAVKRLDLSPRLQMAAATAIRASNGSSSNRTPRATAMIGLM